MHLRLYALGQQGLALLNDLRVDVGAEVARLRIDRLILLLDADAEAGTCRATHRSPPRRKPSQRMSGGVGGVRARATAISATAFTTHWKFSGPTDSSPASGAGFMKSMA